MDRYRKLSKYLKEKYGTRVHKIPLSAGFTCPNRDGTISKGGCIFCDPSGSGFATLGPNIPIEEQVSRMIERAERRFKAEKFIVYFQAYSNTYGTPDKLEKLYKSALVDPRIVELDVSTRPDLLPEEVIDVFDKLKKEIDLTVEIGLQTVNYKTLKILNRGHTLSEFIDAVVRLKKRSFNVVSHVILNLPWDDMEDVVETAKILSALNVDGVKLHSLYVVKNTKLAEMFLNNEVKICSVHEYVERVITFLEYLSPEIIIHRLVADPPKEGTIFGNWGMKKQDIVRIIEEEMEKRDSFQGKKYNYLRR
ncbi:MAG: uncharacterized protein PWQ20_351 [Thermotogaceae bacterium]|jgi:hypothetical protein|nr:uncharacterized protein [Thermotogaceae bacterium]MDN5337281.1 uncharacterized protein [Thermotogaceae bacterium]